MADYKKLCARMADELDHYRQLLMDDHREVHALATEARAALAEPDPEGPTDEELESFLVDVACQNGDMYYADPRVLARAVLARWGRPAPQPVPVSERLPGPGDCDVEGRCWLGGEQFAPGDPTWILGFPAWAERFPEVHRFWLPAHTLPAPGEGEQ